MSAEFGQALISPKLGVSNSETELGETHDREKRSRARGDYPEH